MFNTSNLLVIVAVATVFVFVELSMIFQSDENSAPLLFKFTYVVMLLFPMISVILVQRSMNKNQNERKKATLSIFVISILMIFFWIISEKSIGSHLATQADDWRFDQFLTYPAGTIQILAAITTIALLRMKH